jgi:hypothetical protein
MITIHLRITHRLHYGDLWEMDIQAPNVPRVGEFVEGPDDFGMYRVSAVTYSYSNGFVDEPTPIVIASRLS